VALTSTAGKVFVSYSHKDRQWLDRLRVHLTPLEREGKLELWDDTKIMAGSDWRREIEDALNAAKVAIILISADFLASEFVASNELPPLLDAAKKRGTVIIPLQVSASRFSSTKSLSELQSVNPPERPLKSLSENEQERVLVDLSDQVERILFREGN
jgi:hypothetical protein